MARVQTWADNFGNWHALVTGVTRDGGRESAYVAIRDEMKSRIRPDWFEEDRFSVTLVFSEGDQSEWVETWEGEGIPTRSDVVTCGECGKSFPDLYPSARCPFEYDHAESDDSASSED